MTRLAILLSLSISLTGCGSVLMHSRKSGWGDVYAGTQCSAAATAEMAASSSPENLVSFFAAVDTGLSAALDTLLLPIDWPLRKPKPSGEAPGLHCPLVKETSRPLPPAAPSQADIPDVMPPLVPPAPTPAPAAAPTPTRKK